MTAEIAILNRQAVALAADSAVSTDDKIFRSANKIFSLSKVAPVAVMVYSRADFCGIPWETIIKEYRKKNGAQKYATIHKYAVNFFYFLKTDPLIRSNMDIYPLSQIASNFIERIEKDIMSIMGDKSREHGKLSSDSIDEIIYATFIDNFGRIDKSSELGQGGILTYDMFMDKFGEDISSFYKNRLQKFERIIPNLLEYFATAVYKLTTRDIFPLGYSGIVFAGFGEEELYPAVETYHLGSLVDENFLQLIRIEEKCQQISSNGSQVAVIPFAQDDIIYMFMEGIHPDIKTWIFKTFESVLDEHAKSLLDILNTKKKKRIETQDTILKFTQKIQEKLGANIVNFIYEHFLYPIDNVISILPPNELASLAESLINLTSIKRQISLDKETVGGPTDVALISKGDGLIWIKRKHYFDPHLNHHFFKNYFNNGGHDE